MTRLARTKASIVIIIFSHLSACDGCFFSEITFKASNTVKKEASSRLNVFGRVKLYKFISY